MSHSGSLRRSKRARIATQKSLNNDWDTQALRLIQNSNSESTSNESDDASASDDQEFTITNGKSVADDGDEYEEEDDGDETEEPDNVSNEDSSNAGDENLLDSSAVIEHDRTLPSTTKKRLSFKKITREKHQLQHSRGIPNIDRKGSKTIVFQETFGPGIENVKAIHAAHDRWHLKARDSTLPSRKTIGEALKHEWSHRIEANTVDQTNIQTLSPRQSLDNVAINMLRNNHFLPVGTKHNVVLGPTKRPEIFQVDFLDSLDFGHAWQKTSIPNNEPSTEEGSSDQFRVTDSNIERLPGGGSSSEIKRFHEGWLLNVGGKVTSLAWSPAQNDSPEFQYLAVACQSSKAQRDQSTLHPEEKPHAFSPSPGYRSNVLIWQMPCVTTKSEEAKRLSFTTKAKLSYVIATEIGDIKQVTWLSSTDIASLGGGIGSLVILSTDGCLRIVDLPKTSPSNTIPISVKLKSAEVCIKPPDGAVFSTFTFATPEDIILGLSNGQIRLYSLSQCRHTGDCTPYMTFQLHHTYIMQLVTAGNGELSHFLASSSAAGDLRLTDLRSPHQDYYIVPKSRLPTRNLIYCPLTQSFITTVDHSGRTEVQATRTTISAHQLRHFYSQVLLSKFPNNSGTASSLAGSRLHPYILIGNTQGTVICQNLFKRILPKAGGWVQKLYEYEWIPEDRFPSHQNDGETQGTDHDEQPSTTSEPGTSSLYHGQDVRPGISRFREGFVLEQQDMTIGTSGPGSRSKKSKLKNRKPNTMEDDDGIVDDDEDEIYDHEDGHRGRGSVRVQSKSKGLSAEIVAEVIYEQENAVTAMCWNENPSCAGWVAIGWGSGIVRVEDLSHDTK